MQVLIIMRCKLPPLEDHENQEEIGDDLKVFESRMQQWEMWWLSG